ncbi:RNA-binding protein [Acetobacter sp. AN02]|nr:RNA-binding protein [Acetobacter sp. AN02]MDG6094160.1 RNA-binding protein [Acetobacter sp. AN02]
MDEEEKGPFRRCIVTRERAPAVGMLRFAVSPDRILTPDLGSRLPGRGLWLSARRDVLETAQMRGVFSRAARGAVTVPPDLCGIIEAGLLRRMTDTLGLARRAGQTVCGFTKVRERVTTGQAALIVQAVDGSPEERARLLSGAGHLPVVAFLAAAGMGHVFGRERVVHAALQAGGLALRLQQDNERFEGVAGRYASGTPDQSGEKGKTGR